MLASQERFVAHGEMGESYLTTCEASENEGRELIRVTVYVSKQLSKQQVAETDILSRDFSTFSYGQIFVHRILING